MDDDEQQTVELDGVTYSLNVPPSVHSPLVQQHLSALPTAVPSLSHHVGALSRHVVALSQFDAVQSAFSQLLVHVGSFNLRLCLGRVHDACVSVLMQQMVTLRMIVACPFQNQSLKHFSAVALTLGAYVMESVSVLQRIANCLSALSTALHDAQHSLNDSLSDKQHTLSSLRVQNVSLMQQQSQLLHSLSEHAAHYSRLQASQQRISRRQALCNMFSFVPSMDESLQSSYNLHLLQPVSDMLHTVKHQFDESQREKEQVLAVKRRQREQNKRLMNQLSECEERIQQIEQDIQSCHDQLKHVTDGVQLTQSSGVLALRIVTAFKSIAHACQTLSSSQLASLIDLTCSPSSEKRAVQDGELSVLDASQLAAERRWTMKTAVKQKFVQYYAQWAALQHCCEQCLKQLSAEKQHVVPHVCWDAFDSDACEQDVQSLLPCSSAGSRHEPSCVTIESNDAEDVSVDRT